MSKDNKKEKEPKKKIIKTSFFNLDNILYEQVYDSDTKQTIFAVYNDGDISYIRNLELENVIYIPINDDALTKGAVYLPSEATDYLSEKELIADVKKFIHKYLDISKEFEEIASWYVLLSWVYDRVTTINYLRALGDSGTGKSRFMNVIGGLCYKFCKVSGSVTPAPIYRMINKWKGTLGIEEADFRDSSEKGEIITILNCGFEWNNPVIRADKNDMDKLYFSSTYCPKIINSRRTFSDAALESRCLTEKMSITSRKDIPDILPLEFYREQLELRNMLLAFRFKNYFNVNINAGLNIDLGEIEPRLRQATRSFAAMFANVPSVLEEFKIFLYNYQQELVEEREDSYDGQIINALANLIVEDITKKNDWEMPVITTQNIYDYLVDNKIYKEKDTNKIVISKHLKALKINIKLVRQGNNVFRCIDLNSKDLRKVFSRYISNKGLLKVVTLVTDENSVRIIIETLKKAFPTHIVTSVTLVTEYVRDKIIIIYNNDSIEAITIKEGSFYGNVTDVTLVIDAFDSKNNDIKYIPSLTPVSVTTITDVTSVTENSQNLSLYEHNKQLKIQACKCGLHTKHLNDQGLCEMCVATQN